MIRNRKKYFKVYRIKNKKKMQKYQKIYANKHAKRISKRKKKYYLKNISRISKTGKRYRRKNKDKIKKYRDENTIRYTATRKIRYRKNREIILKKVKEYQFKNKIKIKNRILINVYGIDLKTYHGMRKSQKGRCLICKVKFKTNTCGNIDHDHTTGKIRGLLCAKCNHGLGNFNDNLKLLYNAIKYLSKYKKQMNPKKEDKNDI